jgi:DNA-binding NarL/FixJ family response regulator
MGLLLGEHSMPSDIRGPIQVFVIAPPMVWWGLEHLLQSAQPRIELVGMAPSVDQSLCALGQHAIDVLLLDLEGDDAAQSVPKLQAATRAKLLVVTDSGNVAMLDRAVMAGVRGVVRKSEPLATIIDAIEKVHQGELWVDCNAPGRVFMEMAREAAKDPAKETLATLTMRER